MTSKQKLVAYLRTLYDEGDVSQHNSSVRLAAAAGGYVGYVLIDGGRVLTLTDKGLRLLQASK